MEHGTDMDAPGMTTGLIQTGGTCVKLLLDFVFTALKSRAAKTASWF